MRVVTFVLSALCLVFFSALVVPPSETARADQTDTGGVFPHNLHLDQEMACADCHVSASKSALATDNNNPSIEICLDCHDEDGKEVKTISWGVQPEELTVRQRITKELIFSHEAHEKRGADCEYCHIAEEGTKGQVQIPMMEVCFQCHEGRRGPDDCAVCHSGLGLLRPLSHELGWISHHREDARQDDAACRRCHSEDHCQECHEGGRSLVPKETPTEGLVPYGPQVAAPSLMVERVHDLNYRFTHSLDSIGKESECLACHEHRTFCTDCHESEGDPSQFKPPWHGGSDWGAVPGAVGSGGGRHAEMARRDIETCAACHEVTLTGTDPTCLTCHRDLSPGLGDDPSTHDPGFAGDAGHGEWHEDDGAVCYVCHTKSQSAGDSGFCGYCHGSMD